MGEKYDFPVWATQGGGFVRWLNGYVFVEPPDCSGLTVGDQMPMEWGIEPANELAQVEEDQVMFNQGLEELSDTLLNMAEASEITYLEARDFFR